MSFFDFWKKEDKIDKKIESLHKNLGISFDKIKNDMETFSKWVTHLEKHRTNHHSKLEEVEKRMFAMEKLLEDLRYKREFVQSQAISTNKQTAVRSKQTAVGVQTPVQTGVQTPDLFDLEDILKSLTVMERIVLWTLLNTDLKLSYDDLSVLLGRDKSTLRGQINNIKRKSEGLIIEYLENNGKKRFFVEENTKSEILRRLKREKIDVESSLERKKRRK